MKILKVTNRGLDDGYISELQLKTLFEPLSIGSLKVQAKIISKATGNEGIEFSPNRTR